MAHECGIDGPQYLCRCKWLLSATMAERMDEGKPERQRKDEQARERNDEGRDEQKEAMNDTDSERVVAAFPPGLWAN